MVKVIEVSIKKNRTRQERPCMIRGSRSLRLVFKLLKIFVVNKKRLRLLEKRVAYKEWCSSSFFECLYLYCVISWNCQMKYQPHLCVFEISQTHFLSQNKPRKPMQEQIYQQFSSLVASFGIAEASPRLIIIIINREKIENLLWNIYYLS